MAFLGCSWKQVTLAAMSNFLALGKGKTSLNLVHFAVFIWDKDDCLMEILDCNKMRVLPLSYLSIFMWKLYKKTHPRYLPHNLVIPAVLVEGVCCPVNLYNIQSFLLSHFSIVRQSLVFDCSPEPCFAEQHKKKKSTSWLLQHLCIPHLASRHVLAVSQVTSLLRRKTCKLCCA